MKFITVLCNNLWINIPLFGLPCKYFEETFKKMHSYVYNHNVVDSVYYYYYFLHGFVYSLKPEFFQASMSTTINTPTNNIIIIIMIRNYNE